MNKICRGLFYYHFKRSIPREHKIKPYFFNELDLSALNFTGSGNVGDGEFQYWFGKAHDHDYASYWIFIFYDHHVGGAFVEDS